ncbi:MAG: hypothetical protein IPN17_02085 [Deltaproteobacteria bacterium]|nr:hypothetical protein [Deltaproteobacteria bacterium]
MLDIDQNGRLDALRVALQDASRSRDLLGAGRPRRAIGCGWSDDEVPTLRFVALGPSASPWDTLQSLALDPKQRTGVVLTGLEQFVIDGALAKTAHSLNLARDLLARTIPGPLVIVADAAVLRAIAEQMPDLLA